MSAAPLCRPGAIAGTGIAVPPYTLTREDVKTWQPGEVILLSGKLLTGRDAAHKRLTDM